MSIRHFTPYLVVAGILALFPISYVGYREYQSYVEVQELVSKAVAFHQSLDKDIQTEGNSTDRQGTQKGNHTASATNGFATRQMEPANTHKPDASKKIVKVQVLSPEIVAKYTGGDPHHALRMSKGAPPPVEVGRTWNTDELVTQWIALPDGQVVKILAPPGEEIREGDRVSQAYIDLLRDKRSEINIDGKVFEVPSGVDRDLYMQKALWARTLDISMEAVESHIANQELVVKPEGEPMTAEETKINFNFLRKIPKFESFLRAERPDLYGSEAVDDGRDKPPSDNWEIDLGGVDNSSYLSEPVPKGKIERQPPVPSEPETVSSQGTSDQERISPERVDKARQLIDQYGSEEGLRRLRKSDPEAARRFERHPPVSQNKQEENKGRDAPDGDNQHGSK